MLKSAFSADSVSQKIYRLMLSGRWFVLALGVFVLLGCPPKKPPQPVEVPEPLEEDVSELQEATLDIGSSWTSVSVLGNAFFDTDKYYLRQDAKTALGDNVAVLKAILAAVPDAEFRIEGHCDERGTIEYNLALGERRAKAAKDYYAAAGVRRSKLATISYGEENGLCSDSAEYCWQQNRRAITKVRAQSTHSIPLSEIMGNP